MSNLLLRCVQSYRKNLKNNAKSKKNVRINIKKILFLCFEGLMWRFWYLFTALFNPKRPNDPFEFNVVNRHFYCVCLLFVQATDVTFYCKPNCLMNKITIKVWNIFLLSINCLLLHNGLSWGVDDLTSWRGDLLMSWRADEEIYYLLYIDYVCLYK